MDMHTYIDNNRDDLCDECNTPYSSKCHYWNEKDDNYVPTIVQ